MSQHRLLIRQLLIDAGLTGLAKSKLTIALKAHADGDMIEEELERLYKAGLIQKFVVPSKKKGGPPKTIWRATTKLSEDMYNAKAN